MFTLRYRCKFKEHWYEEEFETYDEAVEAGTASVWRRGTPAEVIGPGGGLLWRKDP